VKFSDGKLNWPHTLLMEMQIAKTTMGKSMEVPQKSKNRIAI
jgi:hypothetical protein